MQRELDKMTNQARFIQMIIDGKLVVSKKAKSVLIKELKEKNFKPIPKAADPAKQGETEEFAEDSSVEGEDEKEVVVGSDAYDYLLGMAIWSLTKERVEKLRQQIGNKEQEIDALIKLSKEDIWRKDLDDFLEEWRNELEDEARREKKHRSMGRRASAKLTIGGRAPARKRKAEDDDSDFAAPKPKKAAAKAAPKQTVNKAKPTGGLLDYLSKASPKSKGFDGASDMDDDSEPEVVPKRKQRATAAKKPIIDEFSFTDSDDDMDDIKPVIPKPVPAKKESPFEVLSELEDAPEEKVEAPQAQELSELDDASEEGVIPKKTSSRTAPKAASKKSASPIGLSDDDDDLSEEEVIPKKASRSRAAPKPAAKKSASPTDIVSDDDFEEEVAPKKTTKSRAAAKPAAKTKAKAVANEDSESDFDDVVSKPTSRRAARKPVKYDDALDSESDDDDQLGDVSQMVKGIGGTSSNMDDSRALFAETSRIGGSASSRAATKARKGVILDDETDYSKLIPSKSPRPSLTVKPKDKPVDIDSDDDEDDEPVALTKPAAKGKAASKAAPKTKAAPASKAKKPAVTKAAPKTKQTTLQLSPAAKAYASKKGKADKGKGKSLADDLSDGDDDIDALADDILDSPPAVKKAAPAARPSRRAATTKKQTYTIDDDSEEESDFDTGGGDDESEDEFYDAE